MNYTNLTWTQLLTKTKDWFNAPKAITEGLRRLKELIDNIPTDSRPYKVYTALLSQTGINPPEATILENTLGFDITFTKFGTGSYRAVPTVGNTFPENKTISFVPVVEYSGGALSISTVVQSTRITIYTRDAITDSFVDDALNGLYGSFIEIRIYD